MLRTSERKSFKTCRWQWQQGYNDHWKAIDEAPALRFGTLIHKALELRYPPGIKRGPKPAETFQQLYDEAADDAWQSWGLRADLEEGWMDMAELGVDMLEHFIEIYGRDEEWKVLGSEYTFRVPVYCPDDQIERFGELLPGTPLDERPLFVYVGTLDGVWENRMDGGVRIHDWKTTGTDPTRVQHLNLDEQATAYWTWGVDALIENKLLKPRAIKALDGMLYTFMRKAMRDDRPKDKDGYSLNKNGEISKRQPPPYFHRELVYRSEHERELARQRALDEFYDMEAIRRGKLVAYKSPGSPPNSHCSWCPLRDYCELHEVGADWEGMRAATFTKWDPYDAHEVEEEGK
jgi:hypothetical protein